MAPSKGKGIVKNRCSTSTDSMSSSDEAGVGVVQTSGPKKTKIDGVANMEVSYGGACEGDAEVAIEGQKSPRKLLGVRMRRRSWRCRPLPHELGTSFSMGWLHPWRKKSLGSVLSMSVVIIRTPSKAESEKVAGNARFKEVGLEPYLRFLDSVLLLVSNAAVILGMDVNASSSLWYWFMVFIPTVDS